MNNFERWIREQPTDAPSQELDKRMDREFSQYAASRQPFLRHPVALWQCAIACCVCLCLGFYYARPDGKKPEVLPEAQSTVYIIQADPATMTRLTDLAADPQQSTLVNPRIRSWHPLENGFAPLHNGEEM